jgi:hypothetical protein
VRSIYQPLTDNGQYRLCSANHTDTIPVPTRAQVLRRLTQFDVPELDRAAGVNHEQPALVFWVNDGLDIEESQ